jgi:competence protein ComEC
MALGGGIIGLWLVGAVWTTAVSASWLRTLIQAGLSLICAAALGAGAAQVRTILVWQPAYQAAPEPVSIEGWVVANNVNESGPRLRLLVHSIDGATTPPRYVRLAVSEAGVLSPGRGARCIGELAPPAGPLAPGGYDFARRAYFERLGATGYAYGRCRPVDLPPPPSELDRMALRLSAVRADLGAAIQAAAPGRGGAIAAALVTGDQSWVDEETLIALRDSGLGHLLSVSGVHMGVVGGLTFASLLWLFALIPPIALRWSVKKIAACCALAVLAGYLVISGASVPAIRSFIMACVAFGAILLDRPAITMRGLALAAFIVVLLYPESVLEPGFQMSFAATMALAALFEARYGMRREQALPAPGPLIGLLQVSLRGIGGVLLISLVAGIATDPFAIYHFQRFSLYALPANLIAAPIMSFLVAPAAGVAAVLAPFGFADGPLQFMAAALDLIAAVGATFGERPEAVRALPRPPDGAFVLCVLALLWASLWVGLLRWGGALLLALSVGMYLAAPQPVLAFDADLRAVFARNDDGGWALLAARGRSPYARERLGAMLGLTPDEVSRLAPPEACDETSCSWQSGGRRFVFALSNNSIECTGADLVLLREGAFPDCNAPIVISAGDRIERGGALVYAAGGRLRIEFARAPNHRRPWTSRIVAQE